MHFQINDLSSKRLYLQIAEKILEMISQGSLLVGEKLPAERKLAETFNVSRPTIREAMIALEVSGIVEIRSGSGVYVIAESGRSELNIEDNLPGPFEILEARLYFESEAAALASQRITHQEIHQLKVFQKKMQNLESQDLAETHSYDRSFHELIAQSTRNSSIYEIICGLWSLRNRSEMNTTFDALIRSRGASPIIEDHHLIIEALQSRDESRARQAMRSHIQRVINEFSECTLNDD